MYTVGREKERVVARQSVEAIVESGVAVQVIKVLSGRKRPKDSSDNALDFSCSSLKYDSFHLVIL